MRTHQHAAQVHIVVASIEKVIPTLEDAAVLLRVLARSATGQESSAYTTFNTGPRRPGDLDGPEQYHVVLLETAAPRCWAPRCRTCCAASAAAPA